MRTQSNFNILLFIGMFAFSVVLILMSMTSQTFAANFLSGDEVKDIISGNTIHLEVPAKGKAKAYMSSTGKVTRMRKKQTLEGAWRINSDGALCIRYTDKKEHCGFVTKNADGTYTRVDDAKVTYHWNIITKGKEF